MNTSKKLYEYQQGQVDIWRLVSLDEIGENEEHLEAIIAKNPEILGFDAIQEGVYGPFRAFRQLSFASALCRTVIPDIVVLSASGHVIIVEVKKYGNPELRDRRVISQIVDYASAFTQKNKEDICQVFGQTRIDWSDFVRRQFPEVSDHESLADAFIDRLQGGKLNMIIACDKVPHALTDMLDGICKQSALDYSLDVVEISLYRNERSKSTLFVPKPRIATTVIGRTVVNVNISGELHNVPSVTVQTTSLEEIEENADETARGRKGRIWTDEELIEIYGNSENALLKSLFDFTMQKSQDKKIDSGGIKINPAFGFYVAGQRNDTLETRTIQLFGYKSENDKIRIYFNMISTLVSEKTLEEFKRKISELFNLSVDDVAELSLPLSELIGKEEQFQSIALWMKSECKNNTR